MGIYIRLSKLLAVWLLLGWILVPAPSRGEGVRTEETRTLSLRQAIQMALKENISLQKLSNTVRGGRIDVNASRAGFLPSLTANLSASKDYPKNGANSKSLSGSLSSSLNLFDGLDNVARLNSANLGWASDTATYSWNRQSIVFGTVSQFVQVVLDGEFVRISRQNLGAQEKQLEQIQAFEKAGNRSKAEVYQQLADIKQTELQVLQAERDYEVSRLTLLRTLGQPADTSIQFKEIGIDSLMTRLKDGTAPLVSKDIINRRADAIAQEFLIRATKSQLTSARSGYWPVVSLSASVASGYSDLVGGLDFSNQFFDENPDFRVGISASFPLFDRLQTKYSVQKAKLQLSDQRLNLEDLQLQIGSQVQQALLDYQTAVKQREAAHAQLEYASEALKISEERFRVGAATYVELSLVRAEYYTAVYQTVSADYNVLLQYVGFNYYSGKIDSAISLFD